MDTSTQTVLISFIKFSIGLSIGSWFTTHIYSIQIISQEAPPSFTSNAVDLSCWLCCIQVPVPLFFCSQTRCHWVLRDQVPPSLWLQTPLMLSDTYNTLLKKPGKNSMPRRTCTGTRLMAARRWENAWYAWPWVTTGSNVLIFHFLFDLGFVLNWGAVSLKCVLMDFSSGYVWRSLQHCAFCCRELQISSGLKNNLACCGSFLHCHIGSSLLSKCSRVVILGLVVVLCGLSFGIHFMAPQGAMLIYSLCHPVKWCIIWRLIHLWVFSLHWTLRVMSTVLEFCCVYFLYCACRVFSYK